MPMPIANPPFDSRVTTLTNLTPVNNHNASGIARGFIIQDKGVGDVQYMLNFLYNPPAIKVSHQTDVTSSVSITPQAYRNPLDKGNWNIPLSASVSFNLLFDRTYEVWGRSKVSNPGDLTGWTPQDHGVWVDVAALYRVVGIFQPKANRVTNSVLRPGTVRPPYVDNSNDFLPTLISNGDVGPMPLTPVTAMFGGVHSLAYHGYISSIELDWTHFSQMMVPMRCVVGISMNLMSQNSWDSDYSDVETAE
ncbi:hypothetical protein [Streptomyces sp. NPDC017448]|uniref:hypothetical protein n=1 Tax=Streptomyces sp. NPDC017448 TaxID=3364996 RepID=UPI0037B6D15D